jgi:hypothetical protein
MRIGGSLSPVELERYERDGILFRIPAITPAEAGFYRGRFEGLENGMGGCQRNVPFAHRCFAWAYELATRTEVVDAVESLLGSDIPIDDTAFFCKTPATPRSPRGARMVRIPDGTPRHRSRFGSPSAMARARMAACEPCRVRTFMAIMRIIS